jgi:hypothetical protein
MRTVLMRPCLSHAAVCCHADAIWVLFAHFTSPAAVSLAASLTQVAVGFAIGAPVHWAMMLAIGARPSKRPYAAKKSA